MSRHSSVCLSLVLAILLALPASANAGPEIFSIVPESGPAGTPIQVKGKGLATTGRVAFSIGRTLRPAQFRIISDEEIEVLAPSVTGRARPRRSPFSPAQAQRWQCPQRSRSSARRFKEQTPPSPANRSITY